MDPFAMFRPFVVRTTDVGGGGGAAPAPAPSDTASDLIDQAVAAGYRDSDVDTPTGPVPGERAPEPAAAPGAPEGTPPAPADDDDLGEVDLANLNYRDGKRLSEQRERFRKELQPYRDAFGALPDDDARTATLDRLKTPGVLDFVAQAHPNDLLVIGDAYAALADSPEAAAAKFRAIADAIAPPGGSAPAGPPPTSPDAGVAAPDDADLDEPLTRREWQAMQAQQQQAAAEQAQKQEFDQQLRSEAKGLGYDPDAAPGTEEHSRFRMLCLTAASAPPGTNPTLKEAHATLDGYRQQIIDGYVNEKKAHASRPAQPETGATPTGATEPGTRNPMAVAEEMLNAELGPDLSGRRT